MYRFIHFVIVVSLLVVLATSVEAGEKVGNLTNIGEILRVLEDTHSEPVVLRGNDKDKLVIVTPKLVGRVMAMTLDGEAGETDGFINAKQLEAGFSTAGWAARSGDGGGWNNFGGVERIWFAPEGGKYGFFFDPGDEQNWHNYKMSYPLQGVPYKVIDQPENGKSVTCWAPVQLVNYAGNKANLEITRKISVLESCPFAVGMGDKVEVVGFESETWAKNMGSKQLTKDRIPVSFWTLGIFNSTEHTVVMLPFKKGSDEELGEPVTTEYFRYFLTEPEMPENYWRVEEECVLIKASGKVQTKLEMLKRRTLGRMAAIDLEDYTMTIVDFDYYPEMDYAASFFLPYEGEVLDGGTMSCFVLGGEINNAAKPAFYELEVCSPIMELQPNEKFSHKSRTYQLRGDKASISEICRKYFKVDINTLEEFDNQAP